MRFTNEKTFVAVEEVKDKLAGWPNRNKIDKEFEDRIRNFLDRLQKTIARDRVQRCEIEIKWPKTDNDGWLLYRRLPR